MHNYIKIETPFNRATDGTKKLIYGDYRNEAVKYLSDLSAAWIWTEKIDGTNIGVVWDGHKVSFQGRTERSSIPAHLVNKLQELFGSPETEELFEQKFGEQNVIFFGEGYGNKIQKVGSLYIPDDVSFILFDVYLPDKDLWLKREDVEELAKAFGIECVPVVFIAPLEAAIQYVESKPMSRIGDAPMEGLVGTPTYGLRDRMGNRIIVKVKVKDFVD